MVTNPVVLSVARNAKASRTPPNCASTPEADVTARRRRPRGLPVATAYASRAPASPPASALTRDTTAPFTKDLTRNGWLMDVKLEMVRLPSLAANDPTPMITVGKSRNTPTYAKNGTAPSHERGSRRPPLTGRAAAFTAGLPADVNRSPPTSGQRRTYPRRPAVPETGRVACQSRRAEPPGQPDRSSQPFSWPSGGQADTRP